MKHIITLLVISIFILTGCKEQEKKAIQYFKKYDETTEIAEQQNHENSRMKFKLLQSKFIDMNEVFEPFQKELAQFSKENYQSLKPIILEQSIPSIQQSIKDGKLTYEKLTLFYLYRIRKFESDSTKYLNAIISLNPKVIAEAKEKDKELKQRTVANESVFGMPILLKDNINTENLPTTAGAFALKNNKTNDAFITKQLKANGALILGKVNLSEWAYYFCSGCPLGYSAIGGQTLNPYGRKIFETGGSSSGSGVATAVNYAVATIGTETAGSITSPSSQNSVVGLKPTIGLLSRSGIVPISSTLDTPGPMTKNVVDSHILLRALLGKDTSDQKSFELTEDEKQFKTQSLEGKRLGVFTALLNDSIYKRTIDNIKSAGASIVEIAPEQTSLQGFLTLLNIDMKHDLPKYLADKNITDKTVKDLVAFNSKDSLLRAPYGQQLFEGIVKDSTTTEEFAKVKSNLKKAGLTFYKVFEKDQLDAILSINNYHAAYSAVAEYPNLTIPMGYKETGEPINLTFIGLPKSEFKLLSLGMAFEKLTKARKLPKDYE
ncbi:amidase family protein [Tenacibaculum jejuense]|uniref:Glutaminyl-tRNA synthase (Glutamine-hydrolyzing) n=1 Tax=Tenacibaculum jejuense TaxID=584609 RepID=A0A238UCQ3_9FLAO|nr:amidase family protein [Tenacibaculum jejuense]SNR16949.1 Glutaminyl-tRNA synthase (Glutamine-hydrolyzing) [Tenacibaculum jejuense]